LIILESFDHVPYFIYEPLAKCGTEAPAKGCKLLNGRTKLHSHREQN